MELSKKIYDKQFTTVTAHKNVQNYYNVWPKKSTEELSFMTLKGDAKFEEKLTCGLENDMRNMENFHQSNRKSQNWAFDGILQSKVGKVWA